MNLTPRILGATAVKYLTASTSEHVLQIGSDHLTRGELAAVGCYNFVAAKNLTAVLRSFAIPNLKHVFDKIPPQALVVPHIGVISLAVLGAAFEAKKIGGAAPLESYVRRHTNGNGAAARLVTFDTLKAHTRAEQARERKLKRQARRKAQASDTGS